MGEREARSCDWSLGIPDGTYYNSMMSYAYLHWREPKISAVQGLVLFIFKKPELDTRVYPGTVPGYPVHGSL